MGVPVISETALGVEDFGGNVNPDDMKPPHNPWHHVVNAVVRFIRHSKGCQIT